MRYIRIKKFIHFTKKNKKEEEEDIFKILYN